MRLQSMVQNSFFLDAINGEARKSWTNAHHQTAFLIIALRQKLAKQKQPMAV